MANYKVAYGKRINITPAIANGTIPPGSIILTSDSNEVFFYDLSKNIETYVSKHKFESKSEAESWIKTYDSAGEVVSVRDGDTCQVYVVNYAKQLVPISSSIDGVSVQADFLVTDPTDPAYIKNKPTSLPITFISGLADALAQKVVIKNKVVPGALMVADSTGNLECAPVTLEELNKNISKKVEIIDTIVEGALMISDGAGNIKHSGYTIEDIFNHQTGNVNLIGNAEPGHILIGAGGNNIQSSSINSSDLVFKEDILVGSTVSTVTLDTSGTYIINIPESVSKYPTVHVYHNGMLLVQNVHYTVSDKFITLIGHSTYAGDLFSFVGYGSTGSLIDIDVYHQHNNKEVLDTITQDMIDKWNSNSPVEGDFVSREELFDSDGRIFPALLPDDIVGGLQLGETSDTAFRGDYGQIAYEHAQEDHAPANAQENKIEEISIGGTQLPVVGKLVNIPIGNLESLGVVKSSTEMNKVFIEEDGTMSVTSIDATKMIVPEGEELILISGDSQK